MPMTPLTGDIGTSDLAVLERWADPNALLRAGKARLTAVIAEASHGQQGTGRAEEWLRAARAAVDLYGGDSAVAFADLAAEVATEVRLRRRHKKVGKVPHQVLVGHVSRARSAVPRRPSPPASSVPEAVASTTQEGGA